MPNNDKNISLDTVQIAMKEKFKNCDIEEIKIFKDEVVFFNKNIQGLRYGLDINVNFEIYLVLRNAHTNMCFNHIFNYSFGKKNKIFDGSNFLLPFKLGVVNDFYENVYNIYHSINQLINSNINNLLFMQSEKTYQVIKGYSDNNIWLDMSSSLSNKLLTLTQTLQYIIDNKVSIVRFGDGEIRCMLTSLGCGFQKHDAKLMNELRDICLHNNKNILVCFPSLLPEDTFWQNFWPNFWAKCKFYLKQEILGDSMITRPELFYFYQEEAVRLWKQIWQGKNVCFITGESSRMNGNHAIFDNVQSSTYIYSKNNNAYSDIDRVYAECLNKGNVDLYLIALGPTGTALAARLAKNGKWALDIGHLNNSYDTVFLNKERPENVPYLRELD